MRTSRSREQVSRHDISILLANRQGRRQKVRGIHTCVIFPDFFVVLHHRRKDKMDRNTAEELQAAADAARPRHLSFQV